MDRSIGVVGGGIVGIAIARALALDGRTVTVLEKEHRVAAHQTGHNSGVVHAGLYYAPGSLKARLCAEGRTRTRDYCAEKKLAYRELGKLVVATRAEELPALERIGERARANGVPGLRRLVGHELREVEPHVAGLAAYLSPSTAAVDFAAITEVMAEDVRQAGGAVLLGQRVVAVSQRAASVTVSTTAGSHTFDRLVVCAGLQSDVIARMVGASPAPKILPFRGEYWTMSAEAAPLVKGMIYPVPDPRYPFLGVHFTRGVYDEVHVGPNAVPALAREGYSWRRVSLRDTWESLTWPGASALARQHWRLGVREVASSLLKPLYVAEARRFVPELRSRDLGDHSQAGVRAQAWAADGSLLDDFAIEQVGPVTLLRNAPSPAATSAMAIADHLVREHLGGGTA
ncbi:MAG: L-2-hydroxyglutarate oxidase [Actinomycetes bacterium]